MPVMSAKAARAAGAPMTLRITRPAAPTQPEDIPETPSTPVRPPSYLQPTTVTRKPRVKIKPFRFLDLPAEIRLMVYNYFFMSAPDTVDLDPANHVKIYRKLAILKTCRLVRREAADFFYSTKTFRIFPCHPGRFFKTRKPLLARMKPGPRSCMTSLELRLGPGWSQPPKGWVVNDKLCLNECVKVWKVRVFVECDPGESVFKGFRQEGRFFENFAADLLTGVVKALPNVRLVEFDAWSSVKLDGFLMPFLIETAQNLGMEVTFGPERGWTEEDLTAEKPVIVPEEAGIETPPVVHDPLAAMIERLALGN